MHIRSPGRVNIIGEHTDYNGGFVLPTTTAAYTHIRGAGRDDRVVRLTSRNLDSAGEFRLDDVEPVDTPSWVDYARGVAV